MAQCWYCSTYYKAALYAFVCASVSRCLLLQDPHTHTLARVFITTKLFVVYYCSTYYCIIYAPLRVHELDQHGGT